MDPTANRPNGLPHALPDSSPTFGLLVRQAAELTADHTAAFGVGSPIDRLAAQRGGKVLLLGVGQTANSLLHVAESHAGVPKRCKYGEPPPNVEVRVPGAPPRFHPLDASVSCSVGFEGAVLLMHGSIVMEDNHALANHAPGGQSGAAIFCGAAAHVFLSDGVRIQSNSALVTL